MDDSKDENGSAHEAWDEEEVKSILTRVIKVAGKGPFRKETKKLDWDVLKPDGRDADECKNMFAKLTKKIRKHRTVEEIVSMTQESLTQSLAQVNSNATRPVSAFIQFCQDNNNSFREKYPDLSRDERHKKLKKKWLKSEKAQILYRQNYHDSYLVYKSKQLLNKPKQPNKAVRTKKRVYKPVMPIPFKVYMAKKQASELEMNPELDKKQLKVVLKSKYNKLAHHKKFHYMKKAMERMLKYKEEVEAYTQSHPNFSSNFELPLSKDEKTTLQICLDKPQSFPTNAYLFYCSKERPKIKEEDMPFSEVSKQLGANYGKLDESEKDTNIKEFEEALSSYIEKLDEYKEKIAPWSEEKAKETSEMIAKYQKILSSKSRTQKKKTPSSKHVLKRDISDEEESKRDISEDEESSSEDSNGPPNSKLRRIQRSSSESSDSEQDDKKSSSLKKELDSSS